MDAPGREYSLSPAEIFGDKIQEWRERKDISMIERLKEWRVRQSAEEGDVWEDALEWSVSE